MMHCTSIPSTNVDQLGIDTNDFIGRVVNQIESQIGLKIRRNCEFAHVLFVDKTVSIWTGLRFSRLDWIKSGWIDNSCIESG